MTPYQIMELFLGVYVQSKKFLDSIVERTKIIKKNKLIIDIESGKTLNTNSTVSMNFWICNPKIFEYTKNIFLLFKMILIIMKKMKFIYLLLFMK